MWEKGFLGSHEPQLLRDTLVFVLGSVFALRAGQEHRNLRMRNSQLSIQIDESVAEYLQYVEGISKTNSGGLSHLKIKRKKVRAYKNTENPERCPVELYRKYLSHVPENLPDSENSFYLRALAKPNCNTWYYRKAAGRETLGNVVKSMMVKAGFEGHYTNHSLRRTCATTLYENNIPEQVIQETTGHRSVEGVRSYKTTSSAKKRKVSEVLHGSKSCQECETNICDKKIKVSEDNGTVDTEQIVVSTDKTRIVISYK